jgi:hypothetical protein
MERTSRERESISSEQIERWRLLALEARTLASRESNAVRNHYLNVATHWEALIEETEAQRKANELEANSTWWPDGSKEGKTQLFLTPGIIFGRFTIRDRVKLIFGAGYQFSVSPSAPAYRNNVILTLRSTF